MKTVSVHPLTRVEGHGRVDLMLRDGEVVDARVAITESPRLFEGLMRGRDGREVPALVCRICAICSAVHRVAACRALEEALDVQVAPLAEAIRELLVLGGHIESHALHLFCLVLPDVAGEASILDLLRADNDAARQGLALKELGNAIQEVAGGRAIHPINAEVGGVLVRPDREQLQALQPRIDEGRRQIERLQENFFQPDSFPPASSVEATRIAVTGAEDLSLWAEELSLSGGRNMPVGEYRRVLAERPVVYSNARHCRDGKTPFFTGALARLELSSEGQSLLAGAGSLPSGIHANNAAQCLEITWALQRCSVLIREVMQAEADAPLQAPVRPGAGAGTAAVEAPRGLLVHHYVLDDLGRVAVADVITPTAINQAAMEEQLRSDLQGQTDESILRDRAERIVRSFDPCISCSVHLIRP
ncbi:MAG: Ni/Fe hydrogenase subunit alpha [Desulfuromonadales bacterium]|nr:Ni/Fe hydrogenase subunit alpha [Desulfuromonadales bacterium]NIR33491.1 Ni/Fe hydrogenase subunit alpha [Desulfuromonadales bacterium]NIS43089.1 Ni/Fe hydrogenase subunit alpha [Desulfuromonadales bacterium]